MSDITRFDPFGYDGLSALMHEDHLGDYVRHADYAKLEAEAHALREEVAALRKSEIVGSYTIKHMAIDITAVGEALGISSEDQEGGTGEFIEAIQELQEEIAALREAHDKEWRRAGMAEENLKAVLSARVVVPDGYALVPIELTRDMWVAVNKEDDRAYAGACDHGAQFDWLWEAAIEAAPRLNGKAVSEGLLRRIVEEQPAVQDIGEMFNWQYARDQAMAELRALLVEGKEVGDVLVRE